MMKDSPQKIHLSDFWSSTFCNVGGRGSNSAIVVIVCGA